MFASTWDSVATHTVPAWFDNAKLGIFLHWGLYSVPGWAPQVADIQQLLRAGGPREMLRSNPYAEWYLNTMQIPGSPTNRHHAQTYGADVPYDAFVEPFQSESQDANLDELAAICQSAGARYVVLTTKHHDGFTLWPSVTPHPRKGHYHAARDLVGDLTEAVRNRQMRMGLYYSGGYDWPWNDAVLANGADAILAAPADPAYLTYATNHVRELVDRYRPSVLWNDISWPSGGNLADLFAYYYNTVEDGVINDRWAESDLKRNAVTERALRLAGGAAQRLWRFIPESRKQLSFPPPHHADFSTPEYAQFSDIVPKKWESTRGVGHSFGLNRNERHEDILTTTELVRSFCDIVSKNGNLLLGIGPGPDGRVPETQQAPVRGLGAWLAINGEAIFGTRPWLRAEGRTSEGTAIRFTQRDGQVYAMLTETPGLARFALPDLNATGVERVHMPGVGTVMHDVDAEGMLTVSLPERIPVSAVHVLRIESSGALRLRT